MKSNQLNAITSILLALVLVLTGSGTRSMAADPCDLSVLPQEIQAKLAKEYPDWQPQRLQNLDKLGRTYWNKAHPKDCPGIAIGHFESKTELSYAILLVPRSNRKQPGFQIIVFSRTRSSVLFASHIAFKWDTGSYFEDLAISKAPPGQYEELDEDSGDPRKVSIYLDGLLYETIGRASSLYYWENGKYKVLSLSD